MKHYVKPGLLSTLGVVGASVALSFSSAASPAPASRGTGHASASRQTTAPAAGLEEMKKLDFLLGEWKGKGWQYSPGGKRAEISQSTEVKSESGGARLGVRTTKKFIDDRLLGIPSHFPKNTIYYDEGVKLYRWDLKRAALNKIKPSEALLIGPKTFQWQLVIPGAVLMRTTIRVTDDAEWHETLEVWLGDDTGWFKQQETVLKKKK